ncbi:MAG: glycine cleavage system protein GcvH [Phycisphaerae bacterium]|nr:glycine cleavage system protein GcvH [Phycisphaerae bacterium]
MQVPSELRYTKEHEWIRLEGDVATIGLTDHAQESLGDIVYLGDLPEEGDDVEAEDVIGVVESVKATSDIYSPISGKVIEVNPDLGEAPETLNEDPYGEGWILRIEVSDPEEVRQLLSAADYRKLVEESK